MTSWKRKLKFAAAVGALLGLSGCFTLNMQDSPQLQKMLQTEAGRAQLAKFIEQDPNYMTTLQVMLFGTGS